MSCNYIRPVIVPIGPSIAYVPLTQGQFALIDSEDAAWVGKHNWYARRVRNSESYYACRSLSINDSRHAGSRRKFVKLHREILRLTDDERGDHRDGNTLDNRKAKLREATRLQNCYNRKLNSNNKTGYKGVSIFRTPYKTRYRASIRAGGKAILLGVRDSPYEAAQLYVEAAKIHHGEYMRQ